MKKKIVTKYAADGKTPLRLVRSRLEWVKKQILAHPEKYDQGTWCGLYKCGTVGCIAGWLDVKMRGYEQHFDSDGLIITTACEAIGEYRWEIPWLFDGDLGRRFRVGGLPAARFAGHMIDKYLKEIGA